MMNHKTMLELKRWNTPTIYNGWEQVTSHDIASECFNIEETRDFMPQMGPMVGRAVTVVFEPSERKHAQNNPDAWDRYLDYIGETDGPKIVVIQDLDKPRTIGAFWGEVSSNTHKALGCVGTIIDGAIRDVDEMTNAGFKAIARRMCVGHAYSTPVSWGERVEVFGTSVEPGRLIHADKHGFLVIPEEDEDGLLEASRFMDSNECQTVIPAARATAGMTKREILASLAKGRAAFGEALRKRYENQGEW